MSRLMRNIALAGITFMAFIQTSSAQAPQAAQRTGDEKVVVVFDEADSSEGILWHPGGWMPDGSGIAFHNAWTENPHAGRTCLKIGYQTADKTWVGIYWLYNDQWGGAPGPNLFELLDIKKGDPVRLTFWARGEQGGERVEFKVGGMTSGQYPDSLTFPVTTKYVDLPKEWKQFTIDLKGKNLKQMSSAFCWVSSRAQNPGKSEVSFYLDDIQFEAGAAKKSK